MRVVDGRITEHAITIYRRHNRPALGPVGDSLDDLKPPFGGWQEKYGPQIEDQTVD
jgi:hypothetical protein